MVYIIFIGIIFVVIGMVMFFQPELMWKITESWKVDNNVEPSKLYIISTKFGGVIFFSLGIGAVVVNFLE